MSYGNEYLADNAYEIEQSQRRWESLCIEAEIEASRGIWRTKDGRVLRVEEMGLEHIKNCIRMLERRDDEIADTWIRRFREELRKRNAPT